MPLMRALWLASICLLGAAGQSAVGGTANIGGSNGLLSKSFVTYVTSTAYDGTIIYSCNSSQVKVSADHGDTFSNRYLFPGTAADAWKVWLSAAGHLYVSLSAPTLLDAQRGLWRSLDNGVSFSRVLDLSALANSTEIWGIDEDSNGNIFAGVYGDGTLSVMSIYRSTDAGASFSLVYNDPAARHVHHISVDRITNYIYATYGDNISPWFAKGILRSTDGGTTWTAILATLPQMVAVIATPTSRIFATDENITGIYRTTDDTAATRVLTLPNASYFSYFARRNPVSGALYIGFVSQSGTTDARIYQSTDDGQTWTEYMRLPATNSYDGMRNPSQIVNNRMVGQTVNGAAISSVVISTH